MACFHGPIHQVAPSRCMWCWGTCYESPAFPHSPHSWKCDGKKRRRSWLFVTLCKAMTVWGEEQNTHKLYWIRIEGKAKLKLERGNWSDLLAISPTWLLLASGWWAGSAFSPWEQGITLRFRLMGIGGESFAFSLSWHPPLRAALLSASKRSRKELGSGDQSSGHHKMPPS